LEKPQARGSTALDIRLEREDREKFTWTRLTEPEQARAQLALYLKVKADPWEFKRTYVWTLDQVAAGNDSVKPFPDHFDYLKFLTYLRMREKLLAIPKSRRMTCSWSFIADNVHDVMFGKGRFNAFVSKKEDDAGELVSRAEFIYNNIPEWRIPRELLPKLKNGKMKQSPPIMEFEETYSKIQGFPQGASQLRQFTLSRIFGDECAFWENAEEFYSASKPTIDGGGGMDLVSSRAPGFFKKLVFDELDRKDLNFAEMPPAEVKHPMQGVEMWKNPRNGYCVVDLHYTANPAKRGREWREAVKSSMPEHQFNMEYEKSWHAYSGMPVYPDYQAGFHSTRESLEVDPSLPILCGVDFGLTPAIVLTQLWGTQLRIFKEFIETNGSVKKLGPVVIQWLKVHYPDALALDGMLYTFIDPAGVRRSEADENTALNELVKAGFKGVRSGPVDWESRRSAVENYLLRVNRHGAGLYVSERDCPITHEGFKGAYRYADSTAEVEQNKTRPIKNAWSHPHDAVQYVAWGAANTTRQHSSHIPDPHYSFNQD